MNDWWLVSYTNDCLSLAVPDSGVFSGAVAGMCVTIVLLLAIIAALVYCHCRTTDYPRANQTGKYQMQLT